MRGPLRTPPRDPGGLTDDDRRLDHAADTPGLLDASNNLVTLRPEEGERDIRFLLGVRRSCTCPDDAGAWTIGNFTKGGHRRPGRIAVPEGAAAGGWLRPGLSVVAEADSRTGEAF